MLGRVKLEGQKKIEKMLNHCITCRAKGVAEGSVWLLPVMYFTHS
jgi:hypothetical protein